MQLTEQLITVAQAYCDHRRLSLARVSTIVFNEGKKLSAIADGRADLATGRFEKAMRWFSNNWPDGLKWPDAVLRPSAPSSSCAGSTAGHVGASSRDPNSEIPESPSLGGRVADGAVDAPVGLDARVAS